MVAPSAPPYRCTDSLTGASAHRTPRAESFVASYDPIVTRAAPMYRTFRLARTHADAVRTGFRAMYGPTGQSVVWYDAIAIPSAHSDAPYDAIATPSARSTRPPAPLPSALADSAGGLGVGAALPIRTADLPTSVASAPAPA
jgi:hypothetical protein